MIFLGAGALLRSAVLYAVAQKVPVEGIFTLSHEFKRKWQELGIPYTVSDNYNKCAAEMAAQCTDGIVFSINNVVILKKPLLSLPGFRFFNIHNGILPEYRGRPESCIFFALLNGGAEYGSTLHLVDEGIDTGAILDEVRFPIGANDTFETVMGAALDGCQQLFERNLASIVNHTFTTRPLPEGKKYPLYRLSDLQTAGQYREHKNFERATTLGLYRLWYGNLFPPAE